MPVEHEDRGSSASTLATLAARGARARCTFRLGFRTEASGRETCLQACRDLAGKDQRRRSANALVTRQAGRLADAMEQEIEPMAIAA